MKRRVLFKLSASIAAYKACQLISKLAQAGYEIQCVCTKATFEFIGPSTLEGLTGRPVLADTFESGRAMDHINLSKWADLTLLCPATANQINKFAHGIADDLVGAMFLAHDFNKPYLIIPAMNEKMWSHPATRKSVLTLREWGVQILEPEVGRQACGDYGPGRMIEPEFIHSLIDSHFLNGEIRA